MRPRGHVFTLTTLSPTHTIPTPHVLLPNNQQPDRRVNILHIGSPHVHDWYRYFSPLTASDTRTLLQGSNSFVRDIPLPAVKVAATAITELYHHIQVSHKTPATTLTQGTRSCNDIDQREQ